MSLGVSMFQSQNQAFSTERELGALARDVQVKADGFVKDLEELAHSCGLGQEYGSAKTMELRR